MKRCLAYLLIAFFARQACGSDAAPLRCGEHSKGVSRVAVSPDGNLIAALGDPHAVTIWNVSDGDKVGVIATDAASSPVCDVAFSRDGQTLALATRHGPLEFWSVDQLEKCEPQLLKNQPATTVRFSPAGIVIADRLTLSAVRPETNRPLQIKLNPQHVGQVLGLAVPSDGKRIAAALQDYGGSFVPKEAMLRVWDSQSGNLVFSAWPNRSANAVAILPDAVASATGKVVAAWDLPAGTSRFEIEADRRAVLCVAFSPDRRLLATGGDDGVIRLWNAKSGQAVSELVGHTGQVHSVQFTPNGKHLVSGGSDKFVLIWSVPHREGEQQED